MSTGRVLWIIWCLAWAGSWALGTVVLPFFGIGFITWIISLPLAVLSLLAILIPIGKVKRP